MAKYAPIGSTVLDPSLTPAPTPDDSISGALGQGLRQGFTETGGQGRALLGRAGESLGFNEFAQDQYAKAAAAQQEAAMQAPEISDFHQIDGVHNGLRFLAGQAGRMAPALGAGALGAALAPEALPFAALTGATLGTAPSTIGAEIERQQADPNVAKQSLKSRNLAAGGIGLADAALMNVVPQALGGKLVGRAAGVEGSAIARAAAARAAEQGAGTVIAKNLSEGVLGNAAAGVGSEALHQTADTVFDPNRDTSQDSQNLFNAGAASAIVGGPFGALGAAGELAGRRGGAVKAAVDAKASGGADAAPDVAGTPVAPAPSMVERAQDFGTAAYGRAKDMLTGKKEPVDLTAAKDLAAGKDGIETIDPETYSQAAPEAQQAMVQEAQKSTVDQAVQMAKELYNDKSLSPESRAALDAMQGDFTSAANRMKIGSIRLATYAGEQAGHMADQTHEFISQQYDKMFGGKDEPARSEMGEGLRNVVSETIMPFLKANRPDVMSNSKAITRIGESVRMFAAMASKGDVDMQAVRYMQSIFGGPALRDIVMKVHEAVTSDPDPAATRNFLKTLGKMQDAEVNHDDLKAAVAKAHDKEDLAQQVKADPKYLDTMVNGIRAHVDESAYNNKPFADIEKTDFNLGMQKKFGSKSKSLLAEFAKEAEARSSKASKMEERGSMTDAENSGTREGNMADQYAEPRYYGVGKDAEAVDSPEVHRAKYGSGTKSPAESYLEKARRENPDRNVSYEPVMGEDGAATGKVRIKAEGMKQDGQMSEQEYNRVRIDSENSAHMRSESRIDTGVRGHQIDARRLVKEFQHEDKTPYNESDDKGANERLKRVFLEGLAATQDHIGKEFKNPRGKDDMGKLLPEKLGKDGKPLPFVVPDSTVLAVRDGKPVRWGDIKDLSLLPDHAGKEMSETTAFLKDASLPELQREAKPHQKVMDAHEIKVDDEIQARIEAGMKPTKENVRAIYKAMETPESKAAGMALFRVQKEIESRSAENLATRVDSASPSMAARRKQAASEALQRYQEFIERKHDRPATKEELRNAKYGIEHGRKEGAQYGEESPTYGQQTEVDPSGQGHIARAGAGIFDEQPYRGGKDEKPTPLSAAEQALVVKRGVDDSEINPTAVRDKKGDFVRTAEAADAVIKKLTESKNPAVKGIGERVAKLNAIIKEMKPGDGERFAKRLANTARASELEPLLHALEQKYHKELSGKGKGVVDVAPGSNDELAGSQWRGSELKKPEAFVKRVLAGGKTDVADLVKRGNGRDVQDVVQGLLKHADDPKAQAALDKINDAVRGALESAKVKGDESAAAYSMMRGGSARVEPMTQREVKDHIEKVLGPDVLTAFKKMAQEGSYERGMVKGKIADMIKLSVHSLDPMSTAFHETMHGFLKHMEEVGLKDVTTVLYKAASSTPVIRQLEKLLANEPGALRQIADSVDERAAYMYQFWANGKLHLGDKAPGVMERISNFIKSVLGIWTNDQRATHIMEYFNSGEYAKAGMNDRSAVQRALLEQGTNKTFDAVRKTFAPVSRISNNIISGGDASLADMKNPAIDKFRNLINPTTTAEGQREGFISSARAERAQRMNALSDMLNKSGATDAHMADALEQLQSGVPAATPEGRLLAKSVRGMLDNMYEYMKDSGVNLGDMGFKKDYFPVVWDAHYIASHYNDFIGMMQKYVDRGDFKGDVKALANRLIASGGNEFNIEVDRPGMQAAKQRILSFVEPADRARFLKKDLLGTLDSYITQGTRRAEWAQRLGDRGEKLNVLLKEAVDKYGLSSEDMAHVQKYIRGIDGTLGDDINPDLRRLYGNAIVYQNLRLLPLAVFSMAVDPMGILVRGGTVRDSFNAFKRGVMEIKSGFEKNPTRDDMYKLSQLMGTIDDATLVHSLGSSFSQGMVGDTVQKVNNAFFKWNLVEQMNTSMRVAAMPAALGFIAKHADGTSSKHSERWLAEMNLKPGDIVMGKDRPLLTVDEFKDAGFSDEEAQAKALQMRGAVNSFVDGAVLRPNAAQKPVWANDPHFALIAHLKQFVYSFNETIMKRVINEAQYGNYTPAMALASYVPTMMAADYMKGLILGGGSQPAYKDDWDTADYVGNGMQRAGLFGVGQFGLDAYKNIKMGGTGAGAVLGPQLEQLGDGLRTIGGREEFGSFVKESAPFSPLVKAVSHAGGADSMFSE
jgi:hypothetical protein